MTDDRHYDVIIIGTGAGGGTLAHRLAPSGKKIHRWTATARGLSSPVRNALKDKDIRSGPARGPGIAPPSARTK